MRINVETMRVKYFTSICSTRIGFAKMAWVLVWKLVKTCVGQTPKWGKRCAYFMNRVCKNLNIFVGSSNHEQEPTNPRKISTEIVTHTVLDAPLKHRLGNTTTYYHFLEPFKNCDKTENE